MKRGKIIVIEGIDGSGKNTQARLLKQYLDEDPVRAKTGRQTKLMSFPQYDRTMFGAEVAAYLRGEFGGLDQVHPKLASLLYACDRLEMRSEIKKTLAEGHTIIMDRYVSSNMAHQAAKMDQDQWDDFIGWVDRLEYGLFDMPRPDHVIFLDVPPRLAAEQVMKKEARTYTDQKQDIHEANMDYMFKVYHAYYYLMLHHQWSWIGCDIRGDIRPMDEIAQVVRYCLPEPHQL